MASIPIGLEGVSFSTAYTINELLKPEFPLSIIRPGTLVTATDGGIWMFAKLAASQTIAKGDFIYVSSTDDTFIVSSLSNSAKALLGAVVGVAGAAATSSTTSYEYIWIQRAGYNSAANCLTGSLANAALHTTATAGRVDDTGVGGSSAAVVGVIQTAVSASNSAPVMLNWPTIGAAD